jgi:hypothetical protein
VGKGCLSTKKGVLEARTLIIRCNRVNVEIGKGKLDRTLDKTYLWKSHGKIEYEVATRVSE